LIIVCDSITEKDQDFKLGYVANINKLFKDLGYKRVVVLAAAGSGDYILSDISMKPANHKLVFEAGEMREIIRQ
jgi:hypothetical protein